MAKVKNMKDKSKSKEAIKKMHDKLKELNQVLDVRKVKKLA